MKYTLAELQAMPTIPTDHNYYNLKVETETRRVWLSHMTVADGAPYDHQVIEEVFNNGRWLDLIMYKAR